MATQAEINAHDELITRFVNELSAGIDPLLSTALLNLSGVDLTDRVAINSLFADLRSFIVLQIQNIDPIAIDNLRLNEFEPTAEIESAVVELKNAIATDMDLAIDEEVNSITGELITAALLGLGIAEIIRAISNRVPTIVSRVAKRYDESLIKFTSILTKRIGAIIGSPRYRYTGGLIATSRPFCTRHNGKVYTDQEIQTLWRGTWEGKAAGDPFLVRGGYNCRHFFILERNNASEES